MNVQSFSTFSISNLYWVAEGHFNSSLAGGPSNHPSISCNHCLSSAWPTSPHFFPITSVAMETHIGPNFPCFFLRTMQYHCFSPIQTLFLTTLSATLMTVLELLPAPIQNFSFIVFAACFYHAHMVNRWIFPSWLLHHCFGDKCYLLTFNAGPYISTATLTVILPPSLQSPSFSCFLVSVLTMGLSRSLSMRYYFPLNQVFHSQDARMPC